MVVASMTVTNAAEVKRSRESHEFIVIMHAVPVKR